jgi:hypothetical protein
MKKALKLALEAFNSGVYIQIGRVAWTEYDSCLISDAITAIKAALAQPEQEPVAWGVFEGNLHDMFFTQLEAQEMAKLKGTHAEVRPLYAAPQRTWVGLTEAETQPQKLEPNDSFDRDDAARARVCEFMRNH